MSHGKIREDKNCLNCGYNVEERFCPNCGQENTQPKQPFHYLFTHFIEDFTHYDGQFWKTMQYLLFRPGKLTKEYLSGKRQWYVAPVKLYIFISFITFFLPSLFSKSQEDIAEHGNKTYSSKEIEEEKKKEKAVKFADSLKTILTKESVKQNKDLKIGKINENDIETDALGETKDGKISVLGATNMKQYDSLSNKNTEKNSLYSFLNPFAKKIFNLQEEGFKRDQIFEKFGETLVHTLPKALFIYLPIFAFFLWLFHNKKKWWYFDHGIFTLHYFSFLLLGILILIFTSKLIHCFPDYGILTFLNVLIKITGIIYMSIYFFVAHHRVYESSKRMSIFKGIFLFILNFIGLFCMFLLLIYASFIMMH